MNTTGNPQGGDTDPAAQAGPAGHEASQPDAPGGGSPAVGPPASASPASASPSGEYPSEPLGEYGYTGGYGYGPGYGDPDGGSGYGYGAGYAGPAYADDPQTSGYGGTQTSGYGDTQTSGYGDPQTPGYGDVRTPGYGDPQTSGYGDPQAPGYGDTQAPGYGDPQTPGYGEPAGGYGSPAPATPPGAPGAPGGVAAAGGPPQGSGGAGFQQVLPVVAATPALKGFPGGPGLDTMTDDQDITAGRDARDLHSPSVWQNAQRAWRDSGVEWQRPAEGYEPAETEWERVQAAPPAKRRPGRAAGPAQPAGHQPGPRLSGTRLTGTPAPRPGQAAPAQTKTRPARPARPSRQPRPARQPGGGPLVRRGVWLTALVIVVVAALIAGGIELFGGTTKPAVAGPAYPPATLTTGFATNAAQSGRNIFQSVNAVAEAGGTVVAAGSQSGQWLPRTQFLVSSTAGRTWKAATVQAPSGAAASTVSPAVAPQFIAHGANGWAALATGASWASPDGTVWTPAAGNFPLQAGDQVAALAGTSRGFLAVGDNVPKGNAGARNPVMWTSSNGLTWQRLGASQLGLPGHVLRISGVAAHGSDVIVYGSTFTTVRKTVGKGRAKHTSTSTSVTTGLWQSSDGGLTWSSSNLPLGSGMVNTVTGVAADGTGFVAVRPASSKSTGPDAAVFTSPTGASWTDAGTITASKSANLDITAVSGSDQGLAALGQSSTGRVVYVSTDGSSWQAVTGLNSAQTLAGVTVATGGTVIAGGSAAPSAESQSPYLAVAAAGKAASTVSFASIPGATGPSLAVSGLAQAAGHQIAVGTANGYPAIWSAASGGAWSQVSSPALSRSGLSTLTAVAHGSAGWLAVGGTLTAAPVRPIVVGSANGSTWQAADGESVFAAAGITLHAVAAGPSGYVVAGQQVVPAVTTTKTTGKGKHKKTVKHTTPAHTAAVIWQSSGLSNWTQALLEGGPGVRLINAVSAYGSGFMAVGSIANAPAAWTSPNGRTWTLSSLSPPAGASTATLQQIAVHGKLIVATGTQTTAKGTAPFADYTTDDGTLWQQEPLTAGTAPASVTALTAAGKGFVATGTAGPLGAQRVVVWWTTNGFSWKTIKPTGTGLDSPGSQAMTALTASGPALTGSGYLANATGEHPTLWHATAGP